MGLGRSMVEMNDRSEKLSQGQYVPVSAETYEPPHMEVVVTASELERETLYAGGPGYGVP